MQQQQKQLKIKINIKTIVAVWGPKDHVVHWQTYV